VVPRLPELGTWLSALQGVNEAYAEDIKENGGDEVRKTVLARLKLAAASLGVDYRTSRPIDPTVADQHKEAIAKGIKDKAGRKAHIIERIDHWDDAAVMPQRLTLLPGTEITVSAVHLLAVFPPQWYTPGRIGAILRTIGIPEEQWGRGFIAAATASVQDTISLVDESGGVVIPAHANSDHKGILRLFQGGLELRKVLEHPALLAMETIGKTVLKARKRGQRGKDACETLNWLANDRGRPDRVKPLCFVKGSDAHECRIEYDGTGEDLGMRYTSVKLDVRPNDTPDEMFGTLKLALLGGQTRIIESPTEDGFNYTRGKDYRVKARQRVKLLHCQEHRPTIIGMTVRGEKSYANGLEVRFGPYLNCVVGNGGKSTLVRTVGYAFGAQGFMPSSQPTWLPEQVRAFLQYRGALYCVERVGRAIDPNQAAVKWHLRGPGGGWAPIDPAADPALSSLGVPVDVWPPVDVQDRRRDLDNFEDSVIDQLVEQLRYRNIDDAKPLLVNQPRAFFNSRKLFDVVLRRPELKARQIIWSTGGPNVPTALDAEKIIVTGETNRGRNMVLRCAGDLSEDEIREQFLDHFEGGFLGFARRRALYDL
jgi:hypothetical protein